MEKVSRNRICLVLLVIAIFVFMTAGCEKKDLTKGTMEGYSYEETEEVTSYVKIVTGKDEVMLLELYPEVAPLTVQNFQKLVQEKFYDGLIFHRVIEGFMIQTGDPLGNGTGGSDETIKGEFTKNGVQNNLKHEKGVISMARSSDMNSASSQFFICSDTNESVSSLDGSYAAFGKVIAGLDTVERISKVQTDSNDKPLKTEKMQSVRFVKVEKN